MQPLLSIDVDPAGATAVSGAADCALCVASLAGGEVGAPTRLDIPVTSEASGSPRHPYWERAEVAESALHQLGKKIDELWAKMDTDGNGKVDAKELAAALEDKVRLRVTMQWRWSL